MGGTTDGMELAGGGTAGCGEGGQNGGIPRHEGAEPGCRQFGAVWAVMNRRSKIHHGDRATVVRRIQQALRWSGMTLRLTYVPSKWNAVDSISRIFKWSSSLQAVIEAHSCSQVLRTLKWAQCSDMGTASYKS